MPTIVLCGKKNVGKSTIFNRLTGMRFSIVYKDPGVTRDRIYGEVEWRGQKINIIDTGGFFPHEQENLAKKITNQIYYSLEEADLIYLVVDGKSGLTATDKEVVQLLRKINKPIFLLINKIDSKKAQNCKLEFSELGFENVFCVSAEAGIGFGELLDRTLEILPATGIEKAKSDITLIILGRPNAGKSTLFNNLTNAERAIVDTQPGTTRDLIITYFTYKEKRIRMVDTCGLKRRSRVKESIEFYSTIRALRFIDDADIAILIFDVTQGVVAQDQRIASIIVGKAKGCIIVPNKIDLVKSAVQNLITTSTIKSFKSLSYIPVIPISAQRKTGITRLRNCILDVHRERNKQCDKTLLHNITEKLQSPSNGKLFSMKQIHRNPPIFMLHLSTSVDNAYIKYVRNTLRSYYGFSGVPVLIKTRVTKQYKVRMK